MNPNEQELDPCIHLYIQF